MLVAVFLQDLCEKRSQTRISLQLFGFRRPYLVDFDQFLITVIRNQVRYSQIREPNFPILENFSRLAFSGDDRQI